MIAKFMTAIVIVSALLVQSVAYSVMACETHTQDASQASSMSMDHTMMGHTAMPNHDMAHESSSHNCCVSDCICPMSACSALSFISNDSYILNRANLHTPLIHDTSIDLKPPYTVLFRPPILA